MFHTYRGEILAVSTRISRPDLPILNPETHSCGLWFGYRKRWGSHPPTQLWDSNSNIQCSYT
jgi:hypothetical protein